MKVLAGSLVGAAMFDHGRRVDAVPFKAPYIPADVSSSVPSWDETAEDLQSQASG
jgi:hypothetical protein